MKFVVVVKNKKYGSHVLPSKTIYFIPREFREVTRVQLPDFICIWCDMSRVSKKIYSNRTKVPKSFQIREKILKVL